MFIAPSSCLITIARDALTIPVLKIKIKGHKTSLSVKTLTGERIHTSFAVGGLNVSRNSRLDAEWINIPNTYTKVEKIKT